MESYVEVTWLFNGILICFSGLLAAMMFQHTIRLSNILLVSFLYAIYLMLAKEVWWLIVAGEAIYGKLVFRRFSKAALVGLSIRLLTILTLHLLLSPSRIGLIWYVMIGHSMLVSGVLVSFLLFMFCLPRISVFFLKTNYSYPVVIRIDDILMKGKGYLDSGNVASHQNIPIVFLSRSACPNHFEQQLRTKKETKVTVRSLHGSQTMSCYHANLHIPGYLEREVLVGFMDELKVKRGCDVLLNVKVFQVHQ